MRPGTTKRSALRKGECFSFDDFRITGRLDTRKSGNEFPLLQLRLSFTILKIWSTLNQRLLKLSLNLLADANNFQLKNIKPIFCGAAVGVTASHHSGPGFESWMGFRAKEKERKINYKIEIGVHEHLSQLSFKCNFFLPLKLNNLVNTINF